MYNWTPKQRYRLASHSERYAAYACSKETEYEYDARIAQGLPDFQAYAQKITKRHIRTFWPVLKVLALKGHDVTTIRNNYINERLWQTMITAAMKLRTQAK